MLKLKLVLMLIFTINAAVIGRVNAESIRLGTFPIPLMVESSYSGIFVDLTKEVCVRSNLKCLIEVFPTLRTIQLFNDEEIIGFFPAMDNILRKDAAKSKEFYMKRMFVFNRVAEPRFTSIKELEGRIVGLTRGYTYPQDLLNNEKIKLDYANTDEQNVKKLELKRIDAFVVEEKSGIKAIEYTQSKVIAYDRNHPISELKVYYAFQLTEAGKDLAKRFSDALISMQSDGKFEQIMLNAL